MAYQLRWH